MSKNHYQPIAKTLIFFSKNKKYKKTKQMYFKDTFLKNDVVCLCAELHSLFDEMMVRIINNRNYSKNFDKLKIPLIFSPGLGGYFIHEVLGHMVEGDYVCNGLSIFGTQYKLNDTIASNILNVVDDISGLTDFIGISKIDDEGQKTKKIQIVKDGRLCGFLCDKASATLLKNDMFMGCSCRQSYLFKALPRMRGTFIEPLCNGINLSDLVNKTEKAILIDNIYWGQANPKDGNFMLHGSGHIINEGKKDSFVDKVIISGNIIDTLNNIEIIGSDFYISPVQCGKSGQFIPVCVGSPSILVNNMEVMGGYYGA